MRLKKKTCTWNTS